MTKSTSVFARAGERRPDAGVVGFSMNVSTSLAAASVDPKDESAANRESMREPISPFRATRPHEKRFASAFVRAIACRLHSFGSFFSVLFPQKRSVGPPSVTDASKAHAFR